MKKSRKLLKLKVERVIPASPKEVFSGWCNPKLPGNPWYAGDRVVFDPKVNGLFYWFISGSPHYGRFKEVKRSTRIQHTWMSPSTGGLESTVTVSFKKVGQGTRMTLTHAGLPDTEDGRGHLDGWNYFLGEYLKQFERLAKKKSRAR